MVERFGRFSLALAAISRSWHRLAADEMKRYGLKGPHAVYLTALYDNPEGVTAARLGELSGKDKADVSRTVSALESKGLVCREAVGEQVYRARLKLTEAGRAAAAQVCRRAAVAVEHASCGVTAAERENFYRVLETIADNLCGLSREGLPRE